MPMLQVQCRPRLEDIRTKDELWVLSGETRETLKRGRPVQAQVGPSGTPQWLENSQELACLLEAAEMRAACLLFACGGNARLALAIFSLVRAHCGLYWVCAPAIGRMCTN